MHMNNHVIFSWLCGKFMGSFMKIVSLFLSFLKYMVVEGLIFLVFNLTFKKIVHVERI